MRVLQINYSANGSTGKIATALHEMLLDKGVDAWFFYGRGKSSLPNTYKIGNEFDYRFHTYFSRISGLHGYYSYLTTKRLILKVKEINPDIIHIHNLHGGYINVGMLFSYLSKSKSKTIITLHDCWLFTGGCVHFSSPYCGEWKYECGNCKRNKDYPKSYFFDNSRKILRDRKKWFGLMDNLQIITVSQWLEQQSRKSLLCNKKISTIYNGIDTKVFYPREELQNIYEKYGFSNNKKIVLGVASVWSDKKGLNQFINLRSQLDDGFQIVLIGLSNKQIKSLPKGIVGIRSTQNQDELAVLYSIATVLINFSKEETFGMVPAEAMACGTPVIVSNTTACPEVVDNNSSFSMDLDNIDLLIKKIQWFGDDKSDKIAENCSNRIRSEFSIDKMLSNYWVTYKRMMEGK